MLSGLLVLFEVQSSSQYWIGTTSLGNWGDLRLTSKGKDSYWRVTLIDGLFIKWGVLSLTPSLQATPLSSSAQLADREVPCPAMLDFLSAKFQLLIESNIAIFRPRLASIFCARGDGDNGVA